MQEARDDLDTIRAWLRLHAAGCGAHDAETLLAECGSIAACVNGDVASLFPKTKNRLAARIAASADDPRIDAALAWSTQPTHRLIHWEHRHYPQRLREIADPPLLLFVIGDSALLNQPQLAIVGSRNPTPTGLDNATAFAHALGQAGLAITSGLALGIDGAAHRGALLANAPTIAVAGTGLDRVYPSRHRALAHEIADRGALVSEFFLGAPPKREHFPQRNRLISGMALGVLVVEAAVQSGSLITARLANEQGREVFAVPGSIHSPQARGCHALIRDGAKLVETALDVLEELSPYAFLKPLSTMSPSTMTPEIISNDEQRLLDAMGYEAIDVDGIVDRSGLTTGAVSSMLLQMELRGLIATCPGGKYLRTFVRSTDERKRT